MSEINAYWKGTNVVTDVLWGDNGKGKFVDYAALYADIVLRYNGADNAGHTVQFGDKKFISHALPSGLLVERLDGGSPLNLITRGALVNPVNIVNEIYSFREQGVKVDETTLLIDGASHLIMPWHIRRDGLGEVSRGAGKIGTTNKGIGPTYSDRAARVGLRVADLFDPRFEDKFMQEYAFQEKLVRLMGNEQLVGDLLRGAETDAEAIHMLAQASKDWSMKGGNMDPDKIIADMLSAREVLRPMVQNVLPIIRDTARSGGNIVGEAGQGGLLDLDQGNYPNVTSSHPGVDGFGLATNIHADKVNKVLGISKAYTTRVGSGPMPTEDFGPLGNELREKGHEYGATTGRPRRCGPPDLVAMKLGIEITGARELAITKVDILDELDRIPVCVAYDVDGQRYHEAPDGDSSFFAAAKPVYEYLPGWNQSTTDCRTYDSLPENAQKYLDFIEDVTKTPIDWVGVGPDRDATIFNQH